LQAAVQLFMTTPATNGYFFSPDEWVVTVVK
jgi:hypothetical protein